MTKLFFMILMPVVLVFASLSGLIASSTQSTSSIPEVRFGSVTCGEQANGSLTIHQTTSLAILDWESLPLAPGQAVIFQQPDAHSVALIRVTGGSPCVIAGSLQATGQIYLIDAEGVQLNPGGIVRAAGIAASTLELSDRDLMTGRTLHFSGSSKATILNRGNMVAVDGSLTLMARLVDNEGQLVAQRGQITLAGGTDLRMTTDSDGRISLRPLSGLGSVRNGPTGSIDADRANLVAAGGSGQSWAINNAGLVQATELDPQGGQIRILTNSDAITNSGRITASAFGEGQGGGSIVINCPTAEFTNSPSGEILAYNGLGGRGGEIETSGQHIALHGTVNAGSGGSWVVDPVDLTIDSAAAQTIEQALNAGTNVTEQTTATSYSGVGSRNGSGSGDIVVAAPLSWTSSATLTLSAYRDLVVNAPIRPNGGSLALTYGSSGTLSFGAGASVNYSATTGQGTQGLSINGTPFTLEYSLATLINDIQNYPSGSFALADSVNAPSASYPHSVVAASLSGTLEGLGNSISGLSITDSEGGGNSDGLIATIGSSGLIRNLFLTNFSLTGGQDVAPYVLGAFTSDNYGSIQNCGASGLINLPGGGSSIGGVTGINESTGSITNCGSSLALTTGTTGFYVGSIVGDNRGTINQCYATGDISTTEYAGEIVGLNEAGSVVENCYATGNVTATLYDVGDLIGLSYGTVTNSWSSGTVSSPRNFVGGLIGGNGGTVTGCYSTGSVQGGAFAVGGLIGGTIGQVTDSYATGPVTAAANTYWVGGLVGHNHQNGQITSCRASGTVSVNGGYDIGGLVGSNDTGGSIIRSYATGKVLAIGTAYDVGGLVGANLTAENDPRPAAVAANPSSITASFAVGSVEGFSAVGGLLGYNELNCLVTDVYAYGPVQASANLGGLVGINHGAVSVAYSTGRVTGGTDAGGLIGNNTGTVLGSYWLQNHNFNHHLFGIGNSASNAGAKPELYDALRRRQTYDSAWGFPHSPIWTHMLGTNRGLPYLNWQTEFFPPSVF